MKLIYDDYDESSVIAWVDRSLQDLFGELFSFWGLRETWQLVKSESSSVSTSPEELAAVYSPNMPVVASIGPAQQLVVIPIETAFTSLAATLVVDAQNVAYWQRLAHAGFKSVQQDRQLSQMESVLAELTESMEESTWLRGLFQSVQSCEATQSAVEVAQLMMPKLCALIQARTVGFLPSGSEIQPVWTDRRNVPESEELFRRFPPRTDHRATIFNAPTKQEENETGVRSLIMAPVRFRGRMYGHLAAVDSGPDRERRPSDGRHLSEFEFGTKEATLVEAAAAMLATHCRNSSLLQSKERLVIGVIRTLGGAVDARDPYTKGHSDRVALYAREIAREMGIDEAECQRLYVTGLLHDVGKIGVPDAVLKKPGRLTEEEYEIIKQHPRQGYEILKDLEDLSFTLPGVLHHHERIDGQGYPAELVDEDIPLVARIMAVADAYDAMTSSRAYRQCMSFERAEQIVTENIGTQFDPQAAAAFLRILPRIHEIALSDSGRRVPESDADGELPVAGPAPPIEIDTAVASLIDV